MFGWWKGRKDKPSEPFPAEWTEILRRNVAHYRQLSDADQTKLRDRIQVFVTDRDWEGCGGLEMNNEIKVTIAAQACFLTLGLEEIGFERVQSILVYPSAYRAPSQEPLGNVVLEGETANLGEAHYRGPVVLSWDEILRASREPGSGENLVFHEFAHQLDMNNGLVDGTPLLKDPELARRWQKVMTAEFEKLGRAVDEGRPTLLDPYGADEEGEFFAVATECFFDRPVEMAQRHKKLYELLREYFRQDPASWKTK